MKRRLITQFSESDSKKLKTSLHKQGLQLGDMKPSDLFRKMRELSCGKVGEELLQELWNERLPPTFPAVLSSNDGNLKRLTTIADKIFDKTLMTSNATFLEMLDQLSDQINALKSNIHRNSRSRFSISKSSQRSQSHSDSKLCWYNKDFNSKANKSKPSWSFRISQKK